MKTTTVDKLVGCVRWLRSERPSAKDDETFLMFGLADQYLRVIFGTLWVNQMLYGMHKRVSSRNRLGRRFMRAENEGGADRFRWQERVLRLAEALFNLQGVEGIDGRVSALAAGQIEDTYAELEAARYLARRGLVFRFVTPSGKKGLDCDAEVLLSEGRKVNCEMKCKIEDRPLSQSGILKSLKAAQGQLPPDEPALVFLKIPESWLVQGAMLPVLSDALAEFFRSTTRVVAVVVRWEESVLLPGSPWGAFAYKYRIERNVNASEPAMAVVEVLERLEEQGTVSWVSFRHLVKVAREV